MAQMVTDAQRAAFEPYVGEWMGREFSGTTVTPDGRAEVVAGLRRCYEAAGLPWPDRVVWVPSPDVGEAVAVAAAAAAERHRATEQWRRATAAWRARRRIPARRRAAGRPGVGRRRRAADPRRGPGQRGGGSGVGGPCGPGSTPGPVPRGRCSRRWSGRCVRRSRRRPRSTSGGSCPGGVRAGRPAARRDGRPAGWLRRHGPRLAGVTWQAFDGYAAAGRLWWWPHRAFVVVSEPPHRLQLEPVGAGAYRLHRADGPAVAWPDGRSLYFWHGVAVQGDLVERGWDVERIHRHPNSEVRRAAIERMGWLTYISAAGLRRVAAGPRPRQPAPSPGAVRRPTAPPRRRPGPGHYQRQPAPVRPPTPVRRDRSRHHRRPGPGRRLAVRLPGGAVPAAGPPHLSTRRPQGGAATTCTPTPARWPWPASPSPEHLAADTAVPVLTGPQAQGDLLVVPVPPPRGVRWASLPAGGHQLLRGEATGNTHWLHQGFDSPGVGWADAADGVRLGYLEVPPGQSALLLHTDEHGANGIGPGTYAIHRKRTYVPSVGMTPRPQPATRLVED